MRIYIGILLVLAFSFTSIFAQQASRADIISFLEKTDALKAAQASYSHMFAMMQKEHPEKKDVIQAVKNEFDEFGMNDLIDELIPIYQKYYTQEDIKKLNEFYSTPTGQKLINVMPSAVKDSVEVSYRWSQKIMKKIEAKIDKK